MEKKALIRLREKFAAYAQAFSGEAEKEKSLDYKKVLKGHSRAYKRAVEEVNKEIFNEV